MTTRATTSATEKPCTAASFESPTTELAATVATVLSSAVPTEPPNCWTALTVAEATPMSLVWMPAVAMLVAGETTQPRPRPMSSSAGSSLVQ
jgi:hypothetical protein